jgi:hypothetical protein
MQFGLEMDFVAILESSGKVVEAMHSLCSGASRDIIA